MCPIRGKQRYIRDEIVPLLGLLETTESHLGTGDKLLGVLEVLELLVEES